MSQDKGMPLVADVKANMTQHVTDKGIAGIFHYLGQEEAIRQNPARQTTDLLKRVFGKYELNASNLRAFVSHRGVEDERKRRMYLSASQRLCARSKTV